MDKLKQSGDQNVLARKSYKNQVKNATNVDEQRLIKKRAETSHRQSARNFKSVISR